MEERNKTIDCLRGYAILLVVVGHAIQTVYGEVIGNQKLIFLVIYSFHMPLFFSISGYLAYRGEKNLKWLKRRLTGLLIPFVSWTLIYAIISGTLHSLGDLVIYLQDSFIYPHKSLWFLLVLFVMSTILFASTQVSRVFGGESNIITIIVFFLILVTCYFTKGRIYVQTFSEVPNFGIFYIGGYLFASIKPSCAAKIIEIIKTPHFFIVSLILYVFSFGLKNYIGIAFYPFELVVYYIDVLLAIVCSYYVVDRISRAKISGEVFNYIGKRTVQIYAFPYGLISTTWLLSKNLSDIVMLFFVVVNVFIVILGALILDKVLNHGIVGKLLYGRTKHSMP